MAAPIDRRPAAVVHVAQIAADVRLRLRAARFRAIPPDRFLWPVEEVPGAELALRMPTATDGRRAGAGGGVDDPFANYVFPFPSRDPSALCSIPSLRFLCIGDVMPLDDDDDQTLPPDRGLIALLRSRGIRCGHDPPRHRRRPRRVEVARLAVVHSADLIACVERAVALRRPILGADVEILAGPYAGLIGTLAGVSCSRAWVELTTFRRTVRAEIELRDLRPVAPPPPDSIVEAVADAR